VGVGIASHGLKRFHRETSFGISNGQKTTEADPISAQCDSIAVPEKTRNARRLIIAGQRPEVEPEHSGKRMYISRLTEMRSGGHMSVLWSRVAAYSVHGCINNGKIGKIFRQLRILSDGKFAFECSASHLL
jgi:hypothetical protein